MPSCYVVGCKNRSKTRPDLIYYRIPAGSHSFHQNRRRLWLRAINRVNWTETQIKNARVCSAHFISGRSSLDSSSPDYVPSVFSYIETDNSGAQEKMDGSTLLPTVHLPLPVTTVSDEVGLVSPPPPHRATAKGTVTDAMSSALSEQRAEEVQDHEGDQSESLDPLTLEPSPSTSNEAHPRRLPKSDKADAKDFTRLDWAPSLNMTTECNESSVKQSEENLEGHQRMPLSAAEKQHRYRQHRDADPEKRKKHLEKERERSRKDKDAGKRFSISELNEREKVAKRKYWREAQAKSRRAKAQLAATLEQCVTPPLSPEPAPGPSSGGVFTPRLNMEMESSAPTSDQTVSLQPITQSDGKDASVIRGAHDLREAEAPEPQTLSTVDVKRRTVSSGIQCPYCRYRCGAKFSFQIHVGSQHPLRCEDVCVGRLGKVVFYQCTAKLFHCHICFFTSKDYAVLFEHLLARHCLTAPKAARTEKGDGEGQEQDRNPTPEIKPDQDDMTEERSTEDSLKRKRSSASGGEDEDEDVNVSDSIPAAAVEHYSDSSSAPYYECKFCKERYKNKGSLLHHVSREHDVPKPHACKECGESFMLESLLSRHINLYHRQERYQCPYCPFESSLAGLHQHLSQCRAVEGNEDKGDMGTEEKE
ncbi:zinc finger protein 845-like isoform X2 [Neoarius graeffei]|uniref:zinc finger protein 845-like isoform X2 n=1 Tax=Neoarius graeffei TaxID=443677 RepID=UPI00298C997E|nr:zinc finger protein 845-like isoform X2 [Neoarius graeffei]